MSAVEDILGFRGRIFGSKGQYRWDHKDHVLVFNANICTTKGKVWYGDLDLTIDEDKIKRLALELKEHVYVLYESDARFENEKNPLLEQAVLSVNPTGETFYNEKNYERKEDGRLYERAIEPPSEEYLEQVKQNYLSNLDKSTYEKTSFQIPWGKIERLSSKTNPIVKFWNEITKSFALEVPEKGEEPKEALQNFYRSIVISEADHIRLKEAMRKWIQRYHDYLSDYRKESELSWAIFLSGPDYLLHDPDWIENGVVYLKKTSTDEVKK